MDRGAKDVLCGLLIVLSLWCYERYVRGPSRKNYAVVLLIFGLACLAKPMAVIIPVLMIMLDYWPLKRVAVKEKLPFFAITAVLAWVTFIGQKAAGALDMAGPLAWTIRLGNAIYSLGRYVRIPLFNKSDNRLSIPKPGPAGISHGDAPDTDLRHLPSGNAQRPWLLTGWGWFVFGLVPTAGLIQAGVQARADRFTYIPQIGLLIMVVWTGAEVVPKRFVPAVLTTAVVVLTAMSWVHTSTWRDSEAVFGHAIAHTSDNWLAELKYGTALAGKGANAGAKPHLLRAAQLNPADPHSRYLLGRAAAAEKQYLEAAAYFEESIYRKPDYADAYFSQASMLLASGRGAEALPNL